MSEWDTHRKKAKKPGCFLLSVGMLFMFSYAFLRAVDQLF